MTIQNNAARANTIVLFEDHSEPNKLTFGIRGVPTHPSIPIPVPAEAGKWCSTVQELAQNILNVLVPQDKAESEEIEQLKSALNSDNSAEKAKEILTSIGGTFHQVQRTSLYQQAHYDTFNRNSNNLFR
jgi:hypothetical protein